MAARPTKGFKVDAGGYCPDKALLNKGLSLSENNVFTSSVSTIEFKMFGLKEGELIKALIKPVFGSKATNAPLLFLKNLK